MGRKLTYNEEEGGMAKAQLQKIEMYAAKLNEMIHPEDELEGWVQNKLCKALFGLCFTKRARIQRICKRGDDGQTPILGSRVYLGCC
jgi:hypothetical protein